MQTSERAESEKFALHHPGGRGTVRHPFCPSRLVSARNPRTFHWETTVLQGSRNVPDTAVVAVRHQMLVERVSQLETHGAMRATVRYASCTKPRISRAQQFICCTEKKKKTTQSQLELDTHHEPCACA